MTKYVEVTPAYGRDYKSAKAAKADWQAGKDFILRDFSSPWNGKPVNIECTKPPFNYVVKIRYNKLQRVCKA